MSYDVNKAFHKVCYSSRCCGLNTTRGVPKPEAGRFATYCLDCGSVLVTERADMRKKRNHAESRTNSRRLR